MCKIITPTRPQPNISAVWDNYNTVSQENGEGNVVKGNIHEVDKCEQAFQVCKSQDIGVRGKSWGG